MPSESPETSFTCDVCDHTRCATITVRNTATSVDLFDALDQLRHEVPLDYAVVWDLTSAAPEIVTLDVRRLLARARPTSAPSRTGPVAIVVTGDLARRWATSYEVLARAGGHRVRVFDTPDEAIEWIREQPGESLRM